nr:hypothetical protein [Tanacetum cinerariifolium]
MPPKIRTRTNPQLTLTQEDVNQLVQDGIAVTIREKRERVRREATKAEGPTRDPVTAPIARECSFAGFMKCGPTQFHGTEGAVGLVRWFEKMVNTFEISECAEVRKVKFPTATLHGRALTWRNSQVATLGHKVANARSWAEVKQMTTDEFCPTEEVQRRSLTNPQPTLTQKDIDQLVRDGIEAAIKDEQERVRREETKAGGPAAVPMARECLFSGFMKCGPTQFHETEATYTEKFNELALLCLDVVPNEKKKVELYIKGLPEIIIGETTSSRPVTLNEAMRMAHALMEQKNQGQTKLELLLNVTVVEGVILINAPQSVKIVEEWDIRPKTAEAR